MIWLVLAVISLVALVILGFPFLLSKNNKVSRSEGGFSVYKQQLDELALEVSRGALSEAEAEPVKIEIQRRLLQASREGDDAQAEQPVKRFPRVVVAILVAVPMAAFSLYAYIGSPDLGSRPLAARNIEQEKTDLAGKDLGNLVARLAARLQEEPDNLDGWILLARTMSRMGRYEEAGNTYLQATRLAENDADLFVGAGENFYFLADGVISEQSLNAFNKAFEINPEHPGARYYLALQDAQSGNEEAALNKWISLYEDSDPNAPFMKIVRGRIAETAGKLDRDVASILASKPVQQPIEPGPSSEDMQAAASMSASDRQNMIENMVERLSTRMDETPNYEGLMRLGQVYGTLGQHVKSADAYGRAAVLQKDNPAPLAKQAFALIQNADEGSPPPEQAVELYRKILELDDSAPEALWYIGISEARAGNRKAALKYWSKLQALAPEDSPLKSNVERAINALSELSTN